ncbi:flagellar motor switch protein FliG [Methylobacterium isbiliense]|jgi:flagellar motor switch protein FliG|uniref:Flagellar motor switch protein FliG n=1 Tax=Methylobacterium isbiliense TaxID=315478 RepID=A0ABQ4SAY0_9HYPH|nr:flagellar motor switch protein FliG [Methylobacterium isbiliense]MDN3623295.1 flagellar motor switch protein FliG [Methylobacterium isbiliense]GJE00149.1 Flagellar motor switch protein FliG [Methylobacterium isbiliense]
MASTAQPAPSSTLAAALANSRLAELPGPQRAAALLLLLGDDAGAPIWKLLEEDEIKKVSHAMVQLGSLEVETVEQLIVEFVSKLSSSGGVSSSYERTESLLLKIFPPEQVSLIMAEVKGASARRVWSSLTQIDPEILASFLRSEYPQTVAVILSRVRSEYAARVLTILPEDFAIDVLNRMLRMETVQKEALRHIEETLRSEFVSTIAQTTRRDAHELMAEVFNAFDRQTEARFLTALDQNNRGAAKKIRQLMFTFEDLLKLDAGSVQTLMRNVDRDTLGRALKGASEPVRAFFFGNMSSRAVKNLQDEMASLGPIRLKEVDEAQAKMTEMAKDLAEKGEIMIAKNSAEEELVY